MRVHLYEDDVIQQHYTKVCIMIVWCCSNVATIHSRYSTSMYTRMYACIQTPAMLCTTGIIYQLYSRVSIMMI